MNKKRLKKCFCKYRLRTKLQSTYHRICQRLYPNSSDKPKDPWYQSHCMLICSILPKANHILTLFSVIGNSHCKISTIYPEIGKHIETSPRRHILSSFFCFYHKAAQLRRGKKEQQTKHKKPLFTEASKRFYPHFLFYFVYYTLIWSDFWSMREKILTRKLLRRRKTKCR